jgi:hypothetical protein
MEYVKHNKALVDGIYLGQFWAALKQSSSATTTTLTDKRSAAMSYCERHATHNSGFCRDLSNVKLRLT